MFGPGISFSYSDDVNDGTINENMAVKYDDQGLYFQGLGVGAHGQRETRLTAEGASEYYWSLLIEPLQR